MVLERNVKEGGQEMGRWKNVLMQSLRLVQRILTTGVTSDDAAGALELLGRRGFSDYTLNWFMNKSVALA